MNKQKKQIFTHKHDAGAVNIPVRQHEIRFCNENVPSGLGWWFQTSPYMNRQQRRSFSRATDHNVLNQRAATRGRLIYRLSKQGIAFAKKMVDKLTHGFHAQGDRTTLRHIIQSAFKRPKAAY